MSKFPIINLPCLPFSSFSPTKGLDQINILNLSQNKINVTLGYVITLLAYFHRKIELFK